MLINSRVGSFCKTVYAIFRSTCSLAARGIGQNSFDRLELGCRQMALGCLFRKDWRKWVQLPLVESAQSLSRNAASGSKIWRILRSSCKISHPGQHSIHAVKMEQNVDLMALFIHHFRYFLSGFLQVQLLDGMCRSEDEVPMENLDSCDLYGNKIAGKRLRH